MPSIPSLRQRLHAGAHDAVVDLHLYSTADGGKTGPALPGWGCPCMPDASLPIGWDGYPLLQAPMLPGERRRVAYVFLLGREAADALAAVDRFFLWEGRLIGEGRVVALHATA